MLEDLGTYDKFLVIFWRKDRPRQQDIITDDEDNQFKMFYTLAGARQRIVNLSDPDYVHAIYYPPATPQGEADFFRRFEMDGWWYLQQGFMEVYGEGGE